MGGKYISKYGRRKVILVSNFALMFVCSITVICEIWGIIICRFFFGYFVGTILTAAPKIIVETVPEHLLVKYGFGSVTNLFTFLFVAINLSLGLLNNKVAPDSFIVWKVVYLFPIPFCLMANIGFMTIYKIDSPTYLIEHGK